MARPHQREFPFIKKKAVDVLNSNIRIAMPPRNISASLNDYYRSSYPGFVSRPARLWSIRLSLRSRRSILRNVFPAMNVTWGSYPNNLGHTDFPVASAVTTEATVRADGRTIPNDCDTCHSMLAVDDPNPKVLTDLG